MKREKFGGKDDDVEQNLQTADSNGVGRRCDGGAGDVATTDGSTGIATISITTAGDTRTGTIFTITGGAITIVTIFAQRRGFITRTTTTVTHRPTAGATLEGVVT